MKSMAVQRGTVRPNRTLSKAERTNDYLQQLFEAGIALGEIDNLEQLLEKVAQIAVVMGHCEGCSILSFDGRKLMFLASLNLGLNAERGMMQFFSNSAIPVESSTIVGHCCVTKEVLNIPDVYHLPQNCAFSYNSSYDQRNNYRCESILAIPMLDSRKNLLGVLELINHISDEEIAPFPVELHEYLRVLANQVGIVLKNVRTAEELRRSRFETVMQFVKACECRDTDMGGHIERIGETSALLYEKLGHDAEACQVMRLAAMLHDVGKISIPDAILKKPGILTPEERVIMQSHARSGHDMLFGAESPMLQMGATIALSHHEKWDGSGYPFKQAGDAIPIEGRIVALVDVFDALMSKRCYKEAWPLERVFDTIKADAGKHFDPTLVEIFFQNIDGMMAIRERWPTKAE